MPPRLGMGHPFQSPRKHVVLAVGAVRIELTQSLGRVGYSHLGSPMPGTPIGLSEARPVLRYTAYFPYARPCCPIPSRVPNARRAAEVLTRAALLVPCGG